MLLVGLFLFGIIIAYVVISSYNDKMKEKKGICKSTGGGCTSPTGCNCSEDIETHIE